MSNLFKSILFFLIYIKHLELKIVNCIFFLSAKIAKQLQVQLVCNFNRKTKWAWPKWQILNKIYLQYLIKSITYISTILRLLSYQPLTLHMTHPFLLKHKFIKKQTSPSLTLNMGFGINELGMFNLLTFLWFFLFFSIIFLLLF